MPNAAETSTPSVLLPGPPFVRTPTDGYNGYYPDCPAYASDNQGAGGLIGFPGNNVAQYIDHANAGAFLNLIPTSNSTYNGLPYFSAKRWRSDQVA